MPAVRGYRRRNFKKNRYLGQGQQQSKYIGHNQHLRLVQTKRHGVSDEGFTINFKENPEDMNGEGTYKDALQYFEDKGYLPSHEELEAKERELRKKHDEDAMDINFHGMQFDFKRDQMPSHWLAHQYAVNNYYDEHQQQQQSILLSNDSLYILISILSVIIIGIGLLCSICIIATLIGYMLAKWVEGRLWKRSQNIHQKQYKSVPVSDEEHSVIVDCQE